MGQYYIAVNRDKREWIHPHRFGDGMKFAEVCGSASGFLAGLAYLLHVSDSTPHEHPVVGSWAGDDVCVVGDYDSRQLYHDAMDSYRDVSFEVIKAMSTDKFFRHQLMEKTEWRRAPELAPIQLDAEEAALYRDAFGTEET